MFDDVKHRKTKYTFIIFNVMKKFISFFTILASMAAMVACSSDEFTETDNQDVDAEQLTAPLVQRTRGAMKCSPVPFVTPEVKTIAYHWDSPFDVFEHFPERNSPVLEENGTYGNFLFESNGESFDLVMLYSNGGYRHHMGIYWYDQNDNIHEQELWNEFEDIAKSPVAWKNFDGSDSKGQISRKSDKAGAYKITLPEGTRFGFYQLSVENNSLNHYKVIKNGEQDYKFYTEQELNWNYNILKNDPKAAYTCQTVSEPVVGKDGESWTIIGMEDISLTYSGCDMDYNDVVFAINPSPKRICDPITPKKEKTDGSVETNLSVSDKGDYDQVKLSIHVRANTDVTVVLPIADSVLADDFAICAKHDVEFAYSEKLEIAGETVELKYSLTEEGYLQIQTKGVSQNILDYCNATYIDGLTFECNLAYGKFELKAAPTITFTRNPYVYITSCANGIAEADDYEVIWDYDDSDIDVQERYNNLALDPKYIHRYYSFFTFEDLQKLGYLVDVDANE